jgi:hypothetical protein
MSKALSLYLIFLKDSNFLVHASSFKEKKRVFTECIILYEFARKYEPIGMNSFPNITTIVDCDSNIDYYVKKYMSVYGIEHVRGGTYSDMVLQDHLLQTLSAELKTMDCFHKDRQELLYDIMKTYDQDIKEPVTILEEKRKESETELSKYNHHYNEYIAMKTYGNLSITYDRLEEIEWFEQFISVNDRKIEEETKKKYKHFLSTVKILFKKFVEIKKRESLVSDEEAYTKFMKSESILRLQHPEFEFDLYMYHPEQRKLLTEKQIHFSKELLQVIEYMYYTVINCCDNYEYTISNYPSNIVEFCEFKIKYYSYLIDKKHCII